ncbi:MAG: glycosyltransferase family 39 protein [Acidobacteriia bacterium]|nr:glycosyltransferase family 39 protein [Terriglobia bacterium]
MKSDSPIQNDRQPGTLLHSEPGPRTVSIKVWVAAALLLTLFAAQNIYEMRRESCTSDEVVHLPAGLTYLLKRDFRLNPEHPPLLKVLCALPLLALRPRVDFNDPAWSVPPHQSEFGSHLLYSNDADRLLFWGRLPIVLISTTLGFFVFRWAQQLYGSTSGLFALGLFAFSPNLVAHSHFVTTDAGVTAFLTIAFYFLWRHLCRGDRRALYWSSLTMGAALAAKFSAIVLFPVALILLWVFPRADSKANAPVAASTSGDPQKHRNAKAQRRPRKRNESFRLPKGSWKSFLRLDRSKLFALTILVGVCLLVVQGAYLGSHDPTLYYKGMEQVNKNHRPDFLYYFYGTFKEGGWWYYFLAAFLVKATSPFIILVLLRGALFVKNWKQEWKTAAFLTLPAAVYFAAVSALADPLGVRYLLPVFPFLMVYAAGALSLLAPKKLAFWTLWILLGWHVASSVMAFPHHLSYFNEFVGGPTHGMDWLDDSNVDWGQELKSLRKVLDERGISSVTLYSFSRFDNPEYYGIHCIRPTRFEWAAIVTNPAPPHGFYAVSAHWLARQKALGVDWMKRFPVIANLGNSMLVFQIS